EIVLVLALVLRPRSSFVKGFENEDEDEEERTNRVNAPGYNKSRIFDPDDNKRPSYIPLALNRDAKFCICCACSFKEDLKSAISRACSSTFLCSFKNSLSSIAFTSS